MPRDEEPILCPCCGAVLVGFDSCPDRLAHERPALASTAPEHVYGGQVRTSYRINEAGFAMIPFRRWDGELREYPCYAPWTDPRTGEQLPWMVAEPSVLGRFDLEWITGLSRSAFNDASVGFPARIPGTRRVAAEATTFIREYIFGNVVRQRRWRRTTRSEKKARHTTDCQVGCRKQHRRPQ